jgi:ABC-type siderophore export system fused ATPase/permease subunit
MSLDELTRSHHAQRSHVKQTKRKLLTKQQLAKRKLKIAKARKQRLDLLPATLNDNMVLTFGEWTALNHISARNGRRIFKSGDGPVLTRLSAKRFGVTVRANKEWQTSRVQGRT